MIITKIHFDKIIILLESFYLWAGGGAGSHDGRRRCARLRVSKLDFLKSH